MIVLQTTDSENEHFQLLTNRLDQFLAVLNGEKNAFYAQFNHVYLKNAVVAYVNNMPVACGAFKALNSSSVEIKRMYVMPEKRNMGVATAILKNLEIQAASMGFNCCVLETGKNMIEAVSFYKKNGYTIIPNYHPYTKVKSSLCFEKKL